MPRLSTQRLRPPQLWQEFELLCRDLWREIWKDPNTQRNGRNGQAQHGVDVYGNPNQGPEWAGVQCKGKDDYANKTLTEDELKSEVLKAHTFTPSLSQFILATTGPRDATLQGVARQLSDTQKKAVLFSVTVWSWDDIVETLEDYPNVVAKHYPDYALTATVREGIDQIQATQRQSLEQGAEDKQALKEHISITVHHTGDVHLRFIQSFLAHGDQDHDGLEVSEIGPGTAACVEDSVGKQQWLILEEEDEVRPELGEIRSIRPSNDSQPFFASSGDVTCFTN
jgi:hypothetical protein